MHVDEVDFPSDPNGELGSLRGALTKALHRADESIEAAKLLASTLGFAASKLRTVYREDGIKSKAQEKREEAAAKKVAANTAKLVAEAAAKLKRDKNPQLMANLTKTTKGPKKKAAKKKK